LRKRLKNLLKELHAELDGADSMDVASRDQLVALAKDIEDTLGVDVSAVDDSDGSDDSPLSKAALEFETDHPRVAGILGQIADTLSKLGI
jgi:hypothetical protein